jgi:hypothetical protein
MCVCVCVFLSLESVKLRFAMMWVVFFELGICEVEVCNDVGGVF